MSVEFYRESPGMFDSRTLNRTTLNRWTGRKKSLAASCPSHADCHNACARKALHIYVCMYVCMCVYMYI